MTRRKAQENQAEKKREDIGKRNQMTALRFQTRECHSTSSASLQGGDQVKPHNSESKHMKGLKVW